jgi:hypothetical protein
VLFHHHTLLNAMKSGAGHMPTAHIEYAAHRLLNKLPARHAIESHEALILWANQNLPW